MNSTLLKGSKAMWAAEKQEAVLPSMIKGEPGVIRTRQSTSDQSCTTAALLLPKVQEVYDGKQAACI